MKAVIIPFPIGHFQRKRQRSLSPIMITKLLTAYALERQGLFFGPQDIKGSLTSLINRGLIVRIKILMNDTTRTIWHVNYEAIEILKSLGIDVVCVKPQVKGALVISFFPLIEASYSTNSRARYLEL